MMSDGVILKMFHIHGMQFRDAMMTQDPLKKTNKKLHDPVTAHLVSLGSTLLRDVTYIYIHPLAICQRQCISFYSPGCFQSLEFSDLLIIVLAKDDQVKPPDVTQNDIEVAQTCKGHL